MRWLAAFVQPELNWSYKSIPQAQLDGREIACARGRGLGGSSAINFAAWLIGDREDFNEWAEKVDDPAWKWDGPGGVKQRFRKIENLNFEGNENQLSYLNKDAQNQHSKQGKVNLSYAQESQIATETFKAAKELGVSPLSENLFL